METLSKQSALRPLLPPEGERLGTYLDEVVRLLGVQSDAGLARLMEVAPSAIANWRRRQVVTRSGVVWFEDNLLALLSAQTSARVEGGTLEMSATIEILRRTAGDPLNMGADHVNLYAGEAFVPLYLMAKLMFEGADGDVLREIFEADERSGWVADSVSLALADRLALLLPLMRRRRAAW